MYRQMPYNTSQWNWIADRLSEGYKLCEVAQFMDMRENSIRQNLVRIKRYVPVEERISLNDRKDEFNALANDGSHVYKRGITVVGVNSNGETVRFNSLSEAARWLGTEHHQISNAIKYNYRCHGYMWRKELE